MTSAYPPGVTQRTIDEAAGGYDEFEPCTLCGFRGPCTRETCPQEMSEEEEP